MEPQIEKQPNGLAPLVKWTPSPIICEPAMIAKPPNSANLEVKFEDESSDDDEKDSIISSSCSLSAGESFANKPKIPDGGWGWVVVFASLIISMIADGISFSFGLLYVEFLNEFGASKSITSWIGSLFMAVPLLTGPIMSALVDRYGCRNMTILGGIISGLGFVLSSYVRSIGVMYLTFGVIAGSGLGMCYVTAVVSIAYWFDKKRSLAVGLGACGTGVGTFIYAPMTQYFIEEYAWRGTVLLLAGTFLNMCVCGTLMRDPEWVVEEEQNKSEGRRSIRNASSTATISGRSVSDSECIGIEEIRKLLKEGEKPEYILQTLVTSIDVSQDKDRLKKDRNRSVVNLPTYLKQSETIPIEVLEQLSLNKRLYNVILENYPNLLLSRSTSDRGLNEILEDPNSPATVRVPVKMSIRVKKASPKSNNVLKSNGYHDPPLVEPETKVPLLPSPTHRSPTTRSGFTRTDSLVMLKTCGPNARHYFKNIKLHKNSVMYRGAMLNIPRYRLRASSCPNIFRNSMTTLAKENEEKWYEDFVEILHSIVDFSLFLDFHFLLLSLSTILLYTWFIVPYFYLVEHLTENGYSDSEASFVISIIGVTNTIGMVALGWAGDQPWLPITKTYSVCLILCGICCSLMMVFTDNYVLLVISAALFGLFFSGNYSLTPAILVELISLDNFTNAYGLMLLCQGIGNLLGPPLAGFLTDITKTWQQSFWQAGVWIVVAGILIGIIPFTKNRKMRRCRSDKLSVSENASIA